LMPSWASRLDSRLASLGRFAAKRFGFYGRLDRRAIDRLKSSSGDIWHRASNKTAIPAVVLQSNRKLTEEQWSNVFGERLWNAVRSQNLSRAG
jgi:hypothetical protein